MTETNPPVPLVVDLDGTLLRRDLTWDAVVWLGRRQPWLLVRFLMETIQGGRARGKAYLVDAVPIVIEPDDLRQSVTGLIVQAKAEGRSVVLASGSPMPWVRRAGELVEADLCLGTEGSTNLTGRTKLEALTGRFERFDYVGNAPVDFPLWERARTPYVTAAPPSLVKRLTAARPDAITLESEPRSRWPLLKLLRPHQWAKNALLALPALAGHLALTPALLVALGLGFLAFSAVASATYVLNDLVDLETDRRHRSKQHRPLAAGHVSVPAAVGMALAVLAIGIASAWQLPASFQWTLAAYTVATLAYSFDLKRRLLLDVVALSLLYTIRVIAGATLVSVHLTRWFLAFSIFVFFSLALAKRVVELRAHRNEGKAKSGRGYQNSDVEALQALGAGAVMAASLVYCLYITSEDVARTYRAPDLLWGGLPLLLYWQARIWVLAARDTLHDDPVVFALRDRVSYLVAAGMGLVVWLATAPAIVSRWFR